MVMMMMMIMMIMMVMMSSRKYPARMAEHTETQLVRCYPAGMRIDSSNFNPVAMWAVGIQMVAMNYQTSDTNMLLHQAFFSQNGASGYVLKPSVIRSPSHVLYRRFNPNSKIILSNLV